MRIVITTTLNDNLFHAKLVPLLRSRPDVELVVVTDRDGPSYERVTWVWPRGVLRWLGRLGGRLIAMAWQVWKPGTRAVMAYNVVPHGMFAYWVSRMRGIPLYLHFIAGRAEVDFAHDQHVLSDNRMIAKSKHPERLERMARKIALRADRIFVPGANTENFLLSLGYARERIVRLHSTIDPARYHPGTGARDIDVLVSAQIRERKRPLFTLRVFREILQARPETTFCWLGDGPDRLEFERAVAELGLSKQLRWERHARVEEFYRRAKVFALCSVSEGLSLACMEAMACGAVPVTSDCGDMAEVVGARGTGSLLPLSADEAHYATEILQLLSNPERLKLEADKAVDIIAREHSFAAAESAWRTVLSSLD